MDCLIDHAPAFLSAREAPLVACKAPAGRSVAVPLSVVAHVAAGLALFSVAMPRRLPTALPEPSVEMVFEASPPAEAPLLLPQAPIPMATARSETAALSPLARVVVPATRVFRTTRLLPVQPTSHISLAPPPYVAVPPPPKPADGGFSLAGFEADVHRAVQHAAVYPPAARLQRRQGRAEIRFDYEDGGVLDAAVAQSSQSGALDRAALEAVRRASLPHPPGLRKLTMLVWVDFTLTAED